MRRLTLVILLLCASPFFAQSPTQKQPYTMLYVFGDSYSDSGSGYIDGNGPTAVVYLAQRLNIPFTWYGDPASTGKGLNFAISGAQTGEGAGSRFPTGPLLGFGMKNQVANFVAFSKSGFIPKIDPENTLFFLAGGLNDRNLPDGATRANLESEIETLYTLGARRFMVALLPTKIPPFADVAIRLNPELAKIPAEERSKHSDLRIANSQWGPFFDEILTHPSKYGFTDTTTQCAERTFGRAPETPCSTPETHFYFHNGHPSTAAHRTVGEMLYQEALTKAP